jgi:membrane protein DedA with SNARE-associated domain
MQHIIDLMRSHGSFVVLAASFLEKIGLPLPALVFLAISGMLIVRGTGSFMVSLAAAAAGCLGADMIWFIMGRKYGRNALYFFCRLSLNPDSCVGRTEYFFRSKSAATVIVSKLVPGVSTLVPPLAGLLRMSVLRYVLLDIAGSLLWGAVGLGLGVLFGAEVLNKLLNFQRALLVLLVSIVAGFVTFKVLYRRYLVRRYSVPKVDSGELYDRMSSDPSEVLIVDLRNEEAYTRSAAVIPGALRIPPARFNEHTHLLSREKDIVLYCT